MSDEFGKWVVDYLGINSNWGGGADQNSALKKHGDAVANQFNRLAKLPQFSVDHITDSVTSLSLGNDNYRITATTMIVYRYWQAVEQ